jgi:hypothetical protein
VGLENRGEMPGYEAPIKAHQRMAKRLVVVCLRNAWRGGFSSRDRGARNRASHKLRSPHRERLRELGLSQLMSSQS